MIPFRTYICVTCGRSQRGIKLVGDGYIRTKNINGKVIMDMAVGGYACIEHRGK